MTIHGRCGHVYAWFGDIESTRRKATIPAVVTHNHDLCTNGYIECIHHIFGPHGFCSHEEFGQHLADVIGKGEL